MLNLDELNTIGKLYAAHNKIHAEYVDARWGTRKKADMQADHEAIVGKVIGIGGRHLSKGEALDDTLPGDLSKPVKLRYMSNTLLLEDEAGQKVSTIQLLRTGTFYHPSYGKFTITNETLEAMVNNFNSVRPRAPTELVVDWEHMSVAEPPVVSPAAGWVRSVFTEEGKLFAMVGWTEKAALQIAAGQYRFISPEIDLNYKDKETNNAIGPTLLSVALTNRPFIEGMEPVVLSEELASMVFSEEAPAPIELAEWTTAYINDLPDSSFAYIATGGEKDEDGRTVPRSLRHLPYKDKDGKVDLPHLRNALARLDQTSLSPAEKAKARSVLVKAARAEGVGEYTEELNEGGNYMDAAKEKELRELLALSEDADIVEAVTALKEGAGKAEELGVTLATETKRADDAEGKINLAKAELAVAKALSERKITPKMRAWALKEAQENRVAFDAYVACAEVVGPELEVKGGDPPAADMALTEMEEKTAKKLGVTREAILALKEKDAANK